MMPRKSDGSPWAAPCISISDSDSALRLIARRSSAGAPSLPRCSLDMLLPRPSMDARRSSHIGALAMMPRKSDGSPWAAPCISISDSDSALLPSALLARLSSAGAPCMPHYSLDAPLPRLSMDALLSSADASFVPCCSADPPWVTGAACAAATSSCPNPPASHPRDSSPLSAFFQNPLHRSSIAAGIAAGLFLA